MAFGDGVKCPSFRTQFLIQCVYYIYYVIWNTLIVLTEKG